MTRADPVQRRRRCGPARAARSVVRAAAFAAVGAGVAVGAAAATVLPAAAQAATRTLSLEEALAIGVEQNFDIQIAERHHQMDRARRSVGAAGFLPSVSAGAGRVVEVEDVTASGSPDALRSDVATLYGTVDLDWTVFDGFRSFATYRRLSEQARLGAAGVRLQVAATIRDIVATYYAVVQQEELLRARQDAVAFSEERLHIARTMRELGSGSEYQLLLARADLNADRAAVIRQELVVEDARLELVRLLGLPAHTEIDVRAGIPLGDEIDFDRLQDEFIDGNIEVEAARLREAVAAARRSEVNRSRLPSIGLHAGYGITRDDERLPTRATDDIRGFHFGITARIPLFEGFTLHRASQVASLELEAARLELQEQRQFAEAELRSEYRTYANARRLVALEEENLELAERALGIALEQFRVANITSIELRETQRLVLDTENRLIEAQYNAKVSETELLRLSGRLAEHFGY